MRALRWMLCGIILFLASRRGLINISFDRCYRLLSAWPAPQRLATMMPVLVEHDWLRRYADFDFTCRAVAGIGQRLSGPNRLAELVPWLREDYTALEADFSVLWSECREALTSDGKTS